MTRRRAASGNVNATPSHTYSAGYELLPTLGNDLRDLRGSDVLIYELIQNADDAVGATKMVFDVTEEALVVENDGVFSDCGHLSESQCPGVELGGRSVRCDFHSFLKISGQAKRQKSGTTGAFGIGFTSVFQITDYPELLSAGRHLILRYDELPAANVHDCAGCTYDHDLAGTTFVLPWARDPDSAMRVGLGVEIPPQDIAQELLDVAGDCIPDAMVFLRRLRRIEVRRDGIAQFKCARSDADKWTVIDDGLAEHSFHILKGEFEAAAKALRAGHPSLLGMDVREASVTIAIPMDRDELRLPIHAVLPTQESVPLGFRLSASLYPFQDRKRLKFESASDGESEWNRAAVRGAAERLEQDVLALAEDIGPERAWRLFRAAHDVAAHVEDAPDATFTSFWDSLAPELRRAEIVWTADKRWARAADVLLLQPQWHSAVEVLQELGLSFVNLSIVRDVTPVAAKIGVTELDLEGLASAIKGAGATSMAPAASLPGQIGKAEGLDELLAVAADLVRREEDSTDPLDVLDGCGIIPCHRGIVAPPESVSAEDDDTRRLFDGLPDIGFADLERIDAVAVALRRVLWPLQPHDVVAALSRAAQENRLDDFLSKSDARGVLRWIASHAGDLTSNDTDVLRSLPIFPTSVGWQPLDKLQLPGPFTKDPLGIAATVDLTDIENLRGFLGEECLGAKTLSLNVYVRDRLVPAIKDGRDFEDAAVEKLLFVLAFNIDDLNAAIVEQLAEVPLLPTSIGRRSAAETYFANDIVRAVLGDAPLVALDERRLRRLKTLLELLGVTTDPRPSDIVAAVKMTVSKPKTADRAARIRTIIEHLGPRYRFAARDREQTLERLEKHFGELLELEWMPVAGTDEWARPGGTHRTEWRTAFESTGAFVDLPEKTVQQPHADLLDLLGVQMRPTSDLVTGHLLNYSRGGLAVAKRVYEALDGVGRDEVARLSDEDCVLVQRTPTVRYVTPSQVVRDPGALRGYLWALPSELTGFSNLIEGLGIADHPQTEHVLSVLRQIGAAAPEGPATERELAAAEACWRILEHGLHGEGETWQEDDVEDIDEVGRVKVSIREDLADSRTWPDRRGVLRRPSELYIDDRPALRKFIPDDVLERLVDRPRFGAEALGAAGLEFLSFAMVQEVIHVPNARESIELRALVRDREDALARIVSVETGTAEAICLLRGFNILEADEIIIRRSIVGEATVALGEHPVGAHLDRDGDRLFVQRIEPPPWTEIAVELAGFLCADHASHAVGAAAAIEKILTAATANAAHAALDLFQIPRLATDIRVDLGEDGDSETLFDDEGSLSDEDVVDEASGELGRKAADRVDTGEADVDDDGTQHMSPDSSREGEADVDDGTQYMSPDSSGEGENRPIGIGRQDGSTPAAQSRAASTGKVAARQSTGATIRNPSHRTEPQRGEGAHRDTDTPWRVWVSGRRGRHQQERSEAAKELQLKVSRRGVERVLQYETEHGRLAAEMPVNHPGFDVESRAAPGRQPIRLIEVKGLSGSWEAEWNTAANPPQMTSEQFRLSGQEGRHWLYVVEHALDDEAWVVFPIQTVGSRANRYLFDHGWKEAADRPFGPGLGADKPFEVLSPDVPSVDGVLFGRAEREDGDIPFLTWEHIALAGDPQLSDAWDAWFTSPIDVEEADFAVQQLETAMGPTLPLGAVAVFRPVQGSFRDGAVMIADVGEDGIQQYAIRRAYVVRDENGAVEGLHLRVDVPGRGDEYEFHDPAAVARIRASYVAHQKL